MKNIAEKKTSGSWLRFRTLSLRTFPTSVDDSISKSKSKLVIREGTSPSLQMCDANIKGNNNLKEKN